jgi:hypothetical protein
MKKIISTALALIVAVSTVSMTAHAASSFNNPGAMPTMTVTNATTNPCSAGPINGCWQTSATAVPGDVLAVHIYYKNTSNEPAYETTLAIQPSRNGTNVSFYGGVASISGPRATGTATATLSQTTTITAINDACWKPTASSACQPVNMSALFGTSGFNIGTVAPGQQGILVARFRVDGTPTNTDQCQIDTFDADDYLIDDGDSTVLRWNTTDCDYVLLSSVSGNQSADGSRTVSPGSTTTYTLRAYDNNGNLDDTDTLTVSVNDQNDQCEIDSFDADDYSIDEGDSVELSWETTDCDYVTLTDVSGNLNADDDRTVSPSNTRTYTLRAYDDNGNLDDTDTLTIDVDEEQQNQTCDIDSFSASPSTITRGSSTTLRWYTTGDVDYVTVSGLSGNRSEDGSVTVSPYTTTTYTLRAYCNNGDTETDTETVYVNSAEVSTAPQAITTVATVLGGTQARLNGIAVPNTTTSSTTAWFEWGTSGAFGNRTNAQSMTSGTNSQYYSDLISGLTPGGRYYYRAAVQNQYGTAYGDTVTFQTTRTTTTTVPVVQPPVRNVVVSQSAPSPLELRVESNYDRMCINGNIDYTITYKNISGQTLEKTVLRFTHPKEITYMMSSKGNYEVVDRTMTIDLGSVAPGETGTITVHARINDAAIRGNLAVATATVVYTNAKTNGQEDAIAYSLITVSDECPNLLGASVFGFGSFLPNTLIGWLLLILVILALIVLARNIYRKKE